MDRLGGSARFLASACAGVVVTLLLVPGAFAADKPARLQSTLAKPARLALDLSWTVSHLASPVAPASHLAEPEPLITFANWRERPLFPSPSSPGIQFTLDPDDEEVVLGWQFVF